MTACFQFSGTGPRNKATTEQARLTGDRRELGIREASACLLKALLLMSHDFLF